MSTDDPLHFTNWKVNGTIISAPVCSEKCKEVFLLECELNKKKTLAIQSSYTKDKVNRLFKIYEYLRQNYKDIDEETANTHWYNIVDLMEDD